MPLTKYGIEAMGFNEIPGGTELEATFNLVRVYRVDGITLKDIEANSLSDLCYKDKDIVFGFGNNLNEVCQYLFNEDFNDDEEKWKKDHKVTPPFLIVHISLNDFFTCKSGYWKKQKMGDKEVIVTYDSFPKAKQLLKTKEADVIPRLITSLTVHLSFLHKPIRFRSILRETYGKTKLGEDIYDIQVEISGKLSISKNVNPPEVKSRIQDSLKLYSELDSKISSFFHVAVEEVDQLKQFLNLFFVLEIYTHNVFKNIDFRNHVSKVNNIPDRINVSGQEFFIKRQAESKTLLQKFFWCALLVWEEIDDSDIEDFKSVKEVRDRIVHGENVPEATLPIEVAERLCLKMLSSKK